MNSIKKHLNKYVIAFIVITGFHCAAAAVVPFVALIGAKQWNDKTLPSDKHYFNFIVNTPDSNYSTFEGNEHLYDTTSHFTGSYTNHDIQFKYDDDALQGRANKSYKGTVNDASNEMTLKGTDATDPLPAVTLNTQ